MGLVLDVLSDCELCPLLSPFSDTLFLKLASVSGGHCLGLASISQERYISCAVYNRFCLLANFFCWETLSVWPGKVATFLSSQLGLNVCIPVHYSSWLFELVTCSSTYFLILIWCFSSFHAILVWVLKILMVKALFSSFSFQTSKLDCKFALELAISASSANASSNM